MLFAYVWVKMVQKVPHTIPITFDHFTGHPQGLCEVVHCCEFYLYLFGVDFFLRHLRSYLPTPPLGQDMTQGQILSGV